MASKFGQFFNYYTNQIGAADDAAYRREQTRALQRSGNEAEMRATISTLINDEIFDAKGNLVPGGLERLHDPVRGEQYVDFMNTATVANNFRNKFGDVEKGIILGPTATKQDTYIFNVRKRDGKLVPMTERRSQDPDDKAIQFTKEDLINFYEAQARNLIQKGGIEGAAIGTSIEQALTRMIGDENVSPEDATSGLGQINEILNKNRPPEQKEAIEAEPSGREPEFTPSAIDQRQMAKEKQFFREDEKETPKTKRERGRFASADFQTPTDINQFGMSPEQIAELKKETDSGSIDGAATKAYRKSKELVSDEKLIALGYLGDNLKDSPLARRQARINFLQDFANLSSPQTETTDTTGAAGEAKVMEPVSQITTIPALPTNIQDARKWFTDNQETLQQLPEEDYTKIQNLLKEQNINSANDLGEAVKRGKISQVDALKVAAAISFAVNGPSGSIDDKLNMYSALTNTFITGDPTTTAADLMNTQSLLQSRAVTMENTLRSTFFEPIRASAKAVMDSLVDEDGDLRGEVTGDFIVKMKQLNNDFLNNYRRVPENDKPAALNEYKRVLGEAIALQSQGSKSLMDFFGDIIADDFQNPQANVFDNIRVRRGPTGKVREIVFVNSSEPGRESEASIFPKELINKFGMANYRFLINNADDLNIPDLSEGVTIKNGK